MIFRWKIISAERPIREDWAGGANCATPGASATVTAYVGGAEVRAFGQGAAEVLVLYPSPEVRLVKKLVSGSVVTEKTFLHHDGLGSVRAVTGAAGTKTETSSYRPFGEQSEAAYALNTPEAKGFIGERFDADAGLQYLNARYYDPRLGMFLQPDWWEVMQRGVGTNRYSYSFNDPVNGKDASGHQTSSSPNVQSKTLGDFLKGLFSGPLSNTPTQSTEAAGKQIKDQLQKFATSTYPRTVGNVVTLGGLSTAEDLLEAIRNRKLGAAVLAAAGLMPAGKLVRVEGLLAKGANVASSVTTSAVNRVQEIQKVLSERTQRSVTTAVTETLEGTRVISSSEGRLRPAQRAALKPGEIAGAGKPGVHAEVNGVKAAKEMGLTPTGVAPSRPACAGCQRAMEEEGVSILGPY